MNLALLEYFVFSLGLVYIVTESIVFSPVRVFAIRISRTLTVMLYCRACFGFWVGVSTASLSPFHAHPAPLRNVLSGMAVMLLGYVWGKLTANDSWTAEHTLATRLNNSINETKTEPENDE